MEDDHELAEHKQAVNESIIILYLLSGAHKGRSVQLCGTAFESDQLEHLPYMDLSSSGGHKCCYHSQCVK